MTKREFYTAIATADGFDIELVEYAKKKLNAMVAMEEKKGAEAATLKAAILEVLNESAEPMFASDVAAKVDISISKASAILKRMAEEQTVTREFTQSPRRVYVYSTANAQD